MFCDKRGITGLTVQRFDGVKSSCKKSDRNEDVPSVR